MEFTVLEKVRHQENEDRDNCITAAVSSARKERMRTQARILTSMAVKVIQLRWKEAQDESQDRMKVGRQLGHQSPKPDAWYLGTALCKGGKMITDVSEQTL